MMCCRPGIAIATNPTKIIYHAVGWLCSSVAPEPFVKSKPLFELSMSQTRGFSAGWIGIGVFLIILAGVAVPFGTFFMTGGTSAGYQFSTAAAATGALGCNSASGVCVVGFSGGNPITFPLGFVTSVNLLFLTLTGALGILGSLQYSSAVWGWA